MIDVEVLSENNRLLFPRKVRLQSLFSIVSPDSSALAKLVLPPGTSTK